MKKQTHKHSAEYGNSRRVMKALVAVPKEEAKAEEERWCADRLKKKKPAT
jgi:hypothetical protein